MNSPKESYLLLLLCVQLIGGADIKPDSLLGLTLVEWPWRRSHLSWAVLSHHRLLLICSRGTPAIEIPIDRPTGASVAFFEKFLIQIFSPLLPFFPPSSQVGSIGVERAGASTPGCSFHSISKPLAHRSG